MEKKDSVGIAVIMAVFLGSIVGLSLTPTVIDTVTLVTDGMSAGAAKSLYQLYPLFWVIFLTAIPVGSIALFVSQKTRAGTISIGDIISVFLPSVVGLALSPTVNDTVTNITVNMSAGATKSMLQLFPVFWIIYLIGIPVSAIAVYFYVKSQ